MSQAEDFRTKAAECDKLANAAQDPDAKRLLREAADNWRSMADQRAPDPDPKTDVPTPGVAGDTGASGDCVMVLGLDGLRFGPGCAGTLTTGGGAEDRGEDADEPAA